MPDGQGKNIMTLQLRWAGHKKTATESKRKDGKYYSKGSTPATFLSTYECPKKMKFERGNNDGG